MENNIVEKSCGFEPLGHIYKDISSDPNFIFQKDPTFNQVMLWDIDSNWVYVNSFVECEHYVLGGWSNLPPVTFAEGLDLLTLSKLLVGLLIINTCIKIFGKFKGKIV